MKIKKIFYADPDTYPNTMYKIGSFNCKKNQLDYKITIEECSNGEILALTDINIKLSNDFASIININSVSLINNTCEQKYLYAYKNNKISLYKTIPDGTYIINKFNNTIAIKNIENFDFEIKISDAVNCHEILNMNGYDHLNIYMFKSDDNDYWDDALKKAIKSNNAIYFPKGKYKFKEDGYQLNKGTYIKGDGVAQTTLIFEKATNDFIFRYAQFSGFSDIEICAISYDFNGNILELNPALASHMNNDKGGQRGIFLLNNIKLSTFWASGNGTGLYINITNSIDCNTPYGLNTQTSLCYFYVNGIECVSLNKGIHIEGTQYGEHEFNQIWMTASSFHKVSLNCCLYGIYANFINNTAKPMLDFGDIKFFDVEVQTKQKGFFEHYPEQATESIYIEGLDAPEWRINMLFNTLTIWDNSNGHCGILKNADIQITNAKITSMLNNKIYKYGFELMNNAFVSYYDKITNDPMRNTYYTGNAINEEINIQGGKCYKGNMDVDGYLSKTNIYNKREANSLNSNTHIESYDANGINVGNFILGRKTAKIQSANSDGSIKDVVKYDDNKIEFRSEHEEFNSFISNGISLEYFEVTKSCENEEIINVNIPVKFKSTPLLIGIVRIDTGLKDDSKDVSILGVNKITNTDISIRMNSKNEKTSIKLGITLIGYK